MNFEVPCSSELRVALTHSVVRFLSSKSAAPTEQSRVFVAGGFASELLDQKLSTGLGWTSSDVDIFIHHRHPAFQGVPGTDAAPFAFAHRVQSCVEEMSTVLNKTHGITLSLIEDVSNDYLDSEVSVECACTDPIKDTSLDHLPCATCVACLRQIVPPISRPRRYTVMRTWRVKISPNFESSWFFNLVFGDWGTPRCVVDDFDLSICRAWITLSDNALRVHATSEAVDDVRCRVMTLRPTAYQPCSAYHVVPIHAVEEALQMRPVDDPRCLRAVHRQARRVKKYEERGFRLIGCGLKLAKLVKIALVKEEVEDAYHPARYATEVAKRIRDAMHENTGGEL
jgi:hypothetical protein